MGSQLLVRAIVTSLVEKIKILLGQESHFSATSRSLLDSSLGIRVSRALILDEQRLVYWKEAVGAGKASQADNSPHVHVRLPTRLQSARVSRTFKCPLYASLFS